MLIDIINAIHDSPPDVKITLCKPDFSRTKMYEVGSAYDISFTPRFIDVDQIEFTLPYYIPTSTHTLGTKFTNEENKVLSIKNPCFDSLIGDMILLVEILNYQQYFVVRQAGFDGADKYTKKVLAYSYEHTFADKYIRNYSVTKQLYNATTGDGILNDILKRYPLWTVGSIDSALLVPYRTFDVSEQSLWDFMRDVQKAFNCIFTFDTINKTISADKMTDIGANTGLYISADNYIKSINITPKYDEIITKLYVTGKDGIGIENLTETGLSVVENYTYFKTTRFMNQDLIDALNTYDALVTSYAGTIQSIINDLNTLNTELADLMTDYQTLLDDLQIKEAARDAAIKTNTNPSIDVSAEKAAVDAAQTALNNQKSLIDAKNTEIASKEAEKTAIQDILDINNNFTTEQISDWSQFWYEYPFDGSSYSDENELYQAALGNLASVSTPALLFNIDSIDFLDIVSEQANWDKLQLGNFVDVEYDKAGLQLSVRLVSYTYQPDQYKLTFQFNNKSRTDDPLIYMMDLLKNTLTTSKTVSMNAYKYIQYSKDKNSISDFMNNTLDLAKQQATAGSSDIDINQRGIVATDLNNVNKQVVVMGTGIYLTKDSLANVQTAISPDGVVADNLVGKQVLSNKLTLENESGSIKMDGSKMTINDAEGKTYVQADLTGMVAKNGASFRLDEFDTGNEALIYTKNNLIQDHSFEMMKSGDMDLTYYDYECDNSSSIWSAVGVPKVVCQDTTYPQDPNYYLPTVLFGTVSVATDSSNYFKYDFNTKPSISYSISGYAYPHSSRNVNGSTVIANLTIEYYDDISVLINTDTKDFTLTTDNTQYVIANIQRCALTFTTPANTVWVRIIIKASQGWVTWDGMELIEASYPSNYNPENQLWSMYRGGLPGLNLNADTTLSYNTIMTSNNISTYIANNLPRKNMPNCINGTECTTIYPNIANHYLSNNVSYSLVKNCLVLTATGTNPYFEIGYYDKYFDLRTNASWYANFYQQNMTYTFSFESISDIDTSQCGIEVWVSDYAIQWFSKTFPMGQTVVQFNPQAMATSYQTPINFTIRIKLSSSTAKVAIKKIKLEQYSEPTDWCPSYSELGL